MDVVGILTASVFLLLSSTTAPATAPAHTPLWDEFRAAPTSEKWSALVERGPRGSLELALTVRHVDRYKRLMLRRDLPNSMAREGRADADLKREATELEESLSWLVDHKTGSLGIVLPVLLRPNFDDDDLFSAAAELAFRIGLFESLEKELSSPELSDERRATVVMLKRRWQR